MLVGSMLLLVLLLVQQQQRDDNCCLAAAAAAAAATAAARLSVEGRSGHPQQPQYSNSSCSQHSTAATCSYALVSCKHPH
jgi:hypothetical protein